MIITNVKTGGVVTIEELDLDIQLLNEESGYFDEKLTWLKFSDGFYGYVDTELAYIVSLTTIQYNKPPTKIEYRPVIINKNKIFYAWRTI